MLLTPLRLGSLHGMACAVAYADPDALFWGLGASGYPGGARSEGRFPHATPALPAPGAGLPPASSSASMACYPVPFDQLQ